MYKLDLKIAFDSKEALQKSFDSILFSFDNAKHNEVWNGKDYSLSFEKTSNTYIAITLSSVPKQAISTAKKEHKDDIYAIIKCSTGLKDWYEFIFKSVEGANTFLDRYAKDFNKYHNAKELVYHTEKKWHDYLVITELNLKADDNGIIYNDNIVFINKEYKEMLETTYKNDKETFKQFFGIS